MNTSTSESHTSEVVVTSAKEIEPMLTASEVAQILGVHQNYVYDKATKGEMPSTKFGGNRRFRWSEVEAWLRRENATDSDPRVAYLGEGGS